MLKNALRRTPGSARAPFICLFCTPPRASTSILSPLSCRALSTTPACLKKQPRKGKPAAAAAAAAEPASAAPSPVDEMRKGIDAIVAKQLAAENKKKKKEREKEKEKAKAKAKAKVRATKAEARAKKAGDMKMKKPIARMVTARRREGMSLAEALKKRTDAEEGEGEGEGEREGEGEGEREGRTRGASRPKGLKVVDPDEFELEPIAMQGHTNPPKIHHDLDRVLFNPGVHYLQDPRSRVYNFDPKLRDIMPVHEFDFEAVDSYITSSKDKRLEALAKSLGKKYSGSTSSMTSILSHFHFLLSHWRGINAEGMSKAFPVEYRTFTQLSRAPVATFLRYKGDGTYAIDADKEFDTESILSLLGRSLEKMLTLPPAVYESLRRANAAQRSGDPAAQGFTQHPDTFHYSTLGDFLMRSQLDAYDPRLPGTGMFDLKTRAVVSVRMDVSNFHLGSGYQIKTLKGQWESFEREYFDMIRAAFLKYSLQVRMGRMDGIFVAFHNTERIFGFQYVGLDEMDSTIHGGYGTGVGQKEFNASLALLNKVLDRATEKFPEQSLRLHFETRETQTPQMYIIAEPVSEKQIEQIQGRNERDTTEFLKSLEAKRDSVMKKAESKRIAEKFGTIEEEPVAEEATAVAEEATAVAEEATAVAEEPAAEEEEDVEAVEAVEAAEALEGQFELGQQGLESSLETGAIVQETVEEVVLEETEEETPEETSEETSEETLEEILEETSGFPDKTPEETMTEATTETTAETTPTKPPKPPLLAMTLTTYNLVNGRAVLRPSYLTPNDKWTIEYNMVEAQSNDRAWNTYHSIKLRRKKAVEQKLLAEDSDEVSGYVKYLRVLSREGRTWAAEQERAFGDEKVVYKAGGHLE